MTPSHKGLIKPAREAGGVYKADKTAVETIDGYLQCLKTPQLSNDGGRPIKSKKRTKRRQKAHNSCIKNQDNQQIQQDIESDIVCGKDTLSKKTNYAKEIKQENNKKQINHPFYRKRGYRKFHLQRADTNPIEISKAGETVKLDCIQDTAIKTDNNSAIKNKRTVKSPRNNGLYAALDLGTNNCRLLIASPTNPGYFRVIDGFSRIVRLGEGLSRSDHLNEAAMERAIEALKICATKLSQYNISYQRLIATEACRAAKNGPEFIERVLKEAGIKLEIVNRETEARLAVSGCSTLVAPETEAVVLFDIGGGSSEIALIDISHRRSPRLADHIIAWTSLPVGVVTLAERFGGELVTQRDFIAMKDHVANLLANFHDRQKLGALVEQQNFYLLGTSGTVTTLAGIHLKLERYDRRRVDGMWMKNTEVDKMLEKLLSWNINERVANPCIGEQRADLVLAGCAILEAIRDIWPSKRLRVADRGLREGILTELMSRSGAWRKSRFTRQKSLHHKAHNNDKK